MTANYVKKWPYYPLSAFIIRPSLPLSNYLTYQMNHLTLYLMDLLEWVHHAPSGSNITKVRYVNKIKFISYVLNVKKSFERWKVGGKQQLCLFHVYLEDTLKINLKKYNSF